MQIDKVYEPQQFEPRWARSWKDSGIFHADPKKGGRVFCLVIPPPNVTGSLHTGHMLEHTEIDMTVRWHRMLGDNTLWLPGTDHAGIATQMVVERKLAADGVSRHDLGREEFEKRVWAWKEQYGDTIKQQMIQVGASCDWSRERFTLDPGLSRAVRTVFVRLFEKGLIYRGEYMINWCPRCRTAISDLETDHDDTQGSLWHIRYPVNGTDEHLVVATTRPETMLGDTAVAINQLDERYTHLHGKSVTLPLMNREIPIILDPLADPEFGTGVVKVTPAHDPNDFEAGKRHNLAKIQVINGEGMMTDAAGAYAGLDRFEARKRIVADLKALGLLEKIQDHQLSIGKCQRCKTVIEPLVSTQWFVKTKPLAERAIEAVEKGHITFIPETWSKTYYEWMYNIRDWCISRQLWWGHRIPAWHCADCSNITVSMDDPTKCSQCGSSNIVQDTDVLDTWFSSGLWPFSTLGWPDKTPELATYYPTSLLITGFDILFFWVARMIMMGLECMDEVPFRHVYIHGLVRDAERQKMSKTKGNTIDPLVVTAKYGTDAVRLSLLLGAAPGTDIILSEERLASARAFANKIWNAARFIFLKMESSGVEPWIPEQTADRLPVPSEVTLEVAFEDRWMFSRLNHCTEQVNRSLEAYRYHEAAQTLWHFVWHEFCDWYVEIKKLRFREGSGLNSDWRNMLTVFDATLRLLHPVMPFITEELWQRLGANATDKPESIALAAFPKYRPESVDNAAEHEMEILQEIVTSLRNLRADLKLDPKQQLDATLFARPLAAKVAREQAEAIDRMGNVKLTVREEAAPRGDAAIRSTPEFDVQIQVPAAQMEERRKRMGKEIEQLEKNIANSERQLSDETFLSKAPEKVVASIRAKLVEYKGQLEKLQFGS